MMVSRILEALCSMTREASASSSRRRSREFSSSSLATSATSCDVAADVSVAGSLGFAPVMTASMPLLWVFSMSRLSRYAHVARDVRVGQVRKTRCASRTRSVGSVSTPLSSTPNFRKLRILDVRSKVRRRHCSLPIPALFSAVHFRRDCTPAVARTEASLRTPLFVATSRWCSSVREPGGASTRAASPPLQDASPIKSHYESCVRRTARGNERLVLFSRDEGPSSCQPRARPRRPRARGPRRSLHRRRAPPQCSFISSGRPGTETGDLDGEIVGMERQALEGGPTLGSSIADSGPIALVGLNT